MLVSFYVMVFADWNIDTFYNGALYMVWEFKIALKEILENALDSALGAISKTTEVDLINIINIKNLLYFSMWQLAFPINLTDLSLYFTSKISELFFSN